jgi:predicted MFS family arabinose efflux permease
MALHSTAGSQLSPGRLMTLIASRFVINAIFRIAYPLVPFIALRFGISEAQATAIVTVQVALGLASLLGGWLGDRIGYRSTMSLGLVSILLGALSLVFAPSFGWFVVAYAACGFGGSVYQPAMQAYVSSLTAYEQRGRVIGLVELSWALSGLLALPPLMWLVQWQNDVWGAFAILAAGATAVLGITLVMLPADQRRLSQPSSEDVQPWWVLQQPSVRALCAFLFLVVGGNELLFVAQAPWVTDRFSASPANLGTAAFVFGLGELAGSLMASLFIDRFGKLRAAVGGFALTAIMFLLLPLFSTSWNIYLLLFAIYAVCIEFAIVASIALSSTVSMVRRATVMAVAVVSIQLGRALGSQIGVPLLTNTSLVINGLVAAIITMVGGLIALRWVREGERQVPFVDGEAVGEF